MMPELSTDALARRGSKARPGQWRGFNLLNYFTAGHPEPFREEELKAAEIEGVELYSGDKEGLHTSAGGGLKLIMNRNMILAVDMGRALDSRDGEKFKVFVGFNYIF